MLRKRLLTILLTLSLLVTVFSGSFHVFAAEALTDYDASETIPVIYIPLDNRPFNYSEVCTYAASIGIQLIMPDEALFATTLDGQASTSDLQHGDLAALMEWLMSNADRADVMVLSLDQLLSGGLMSSRTLESCSYLTLSDGTMMTEYDIIDYIAALAADHEIYLLDSVLRLASSSGYAGYTTTDYTVTRAYGKVQRPELSGDALTIENIISNYRLAYDGSNALDYAGLSTENMQYFLSSADSDTVTPGAEADHSRLQCYLNIRERKLRLNAYAIEMLAGLENTHYYMGVDDSSDGGNIQTSEISYLLQLADGNMEIIDALDGITQQLLTMIVSKALSVPLPTISVTWFGDSADSCQSYSRTTIRQGLASTAASLGITLTDSSAELSVLAYTSSSSADASDSAVYALASQINENEAAGIPTVLIFYSSCTASQKQLLADSCHLGSLLAVAGNYQPSGATMGLSMGVGRYLMLAAGTLTDAQNQAHIENLAESLVYVWYDGSTERAEMVQLISSLGLNTTNFGDISAETEAYINAQLTAKVEAASASVLSSISGSSFFVSLQPCETAGIESVTLESVSYPWMRNFEAEFTLQAVLKADTSGSGTYHPLFIHGTTKTTFSPEAPATREQLVTLLVRASGVPVSTTAELRFTDVSDYAAVSVQTAAENGWIHGYEDGTFRGSIPMTRAEFCTTLVNFLDSQGTTLQPVREISFSDVPETGLWYSEKIYRLARAGYITGYPEGTFRPDQQITRAEAVTLLCRILGRTEELSGSLAYVPRFTDVSADHWAFRSIQEGSVSHFCAD